VEDNSMTKLLENAFQRVSQLSEVEQDAIAAALLDVFQDDQQDNAAWDALVDSAASQRLLEEMARRVEDAIARGETL
jgi:hypothetical protein